MLIETKPVPLVEAPRVLGRVSGIVEFRRTLVESKRPGAAVSGVAFPSDADEEFSQEWSWNGLRVHKRHVSHSTRCTKR